MKKNLNSVSGQSFNLYLSMKYLFPKRKNRGRILFKIVILGLFLGVFAQLLISGIMNGLQEDQIYPLTYLESFHLRVEADNELDTKRIYENLSQSNLKNDFSSITIFKEGEGMAKAEFGSLISRGVVIRAIEPSELQFMRDWAEKARIDYEFREIDGFVFDNNSLICSRRLLSGRTNSSINLSTIDSQNGGLISNKFNLAAQIYFDFPKFDYNYVFINYNSDFAKSVSEDSIIGIRLNNTSQLNSIASKIKQISKDLGINNPKITSFENYNKAIFGALKVEKTFIFILVSLIYIVVSLNLFHGLRVSIREKSEDIAIFSTLGARPKDIQRIFILQGLIIGLFGGGLGLIFGLLTGLFFDPIQEVLMSVLGTNIKYPISFHLDEVIFSFSFSIFGSIFAAILATRSIKISKPTEILRHV